MTHDDAQAGSSATNPLPATAEGARPVRGQFASPSQIRVVVCGLFVVLGLLSFEVLHYLLATHLGADDHAEAFASVHPQCKELGSRYELLCPFPGYNSIHLQCMENECGNHDLNMPPATAANRERNKADYRADTIASLAVEAPYNSRSAEWQQWAIDVHMGKRPVLDRRVDMNKPPQRIDDAQRIVEERSLMISAQIAQEFTKTHGE